MSRHIFTKLTQATLTEETRVQKIMAILELMPEVNKTVLAELTLLIRKIAKAHKSVRTKLRQIALIYVRIQPAT